MYVYCDNAATTPLSKQAYDAMLPWLETGYGNASSIYRLAREAKVALEGARKTVAGCLGVAPEEVYFTSGGTESDNWALKSGAELGGGERRHIVISAVEHHAVVNTAEYLSKKKGYTHTEAAADKDGLVSAEALQKALRPNTALVSVIAANNEIGTIQPIEELAGLTKEYDKKILFHTDAVQAAGHIPLPLNGDVDMLSMSAHKFGGPKGVGVLYIKNGVKLPPLLHGGGHERGRRSSTENVAGILGLAAALEYMTSNREAFAAKVTKLREMLIGGILSTVPYCKLTGHREKRLPGTASFIFAALEGESLVLRLDELGVAGSSGSACASGSLDPSHVLMAIGLPHETAHGSLRLTVSHTNTEEEMEFVIRAVAAAAERCRAISPLWDINRPAASFLPYFE
ncbi:MAG: aminotransferase class V-fold PLP-dependent enzyme [Oscillospiraceae bacterium]|jgi:cysteine desulfurase|nr:aminotransferase class V-fold PLP-dependent enzyme [Oscillospiraceae bacterium]